MTESSKSAPSHAARINELNDTIRYTMWSVFRLRDVLGGDADRAAESADLDALFESLAEEDVTSAGCTTSRACAPTPT